MALTLSAAPLRRWWIIIGSAGAFIALAVSVHHGLLNAFDSTVREWVRPQDMWGTVQVRVDYVVEGLRPVVVAGLLVAFTVAVSIRRRSPRLLVFVGSVLLTTVALTVAAKMAVDRPDPHGIVASHGGSFPSGHTISVTVCLGLAVLVAQPRAGRWIWLVPALGGGLMGASLVIQVAHWSTDVFGGGLFALAILATVSATGWARWSRGGQGSNQGRPVPGPSAAASLSPAGAAGPQGEAGSQLAD